MPRLIMPRWMILIGALAAQAALTGAMVRSPPVGLAQAAFILGLIAYSVLKRQPLLALFVLAYLPAAEIVWRQTRAPVPWQIAPYLTIAIGAILALTLFGQFTKPGRLAMLFLVMLIPSIIITVSVAGGNSREVIAFALSGPAAVASLIFVFSQIAIEGWAYRRMLWVMLVSGIGPLTAAVISIDQYVSENGELRFQAESNFVTSGGFGPVQVASIMGLTVLIAVLAFVAEPQRVPRMISAVVGVAATILSFLTFSRGGMTATVLALSAFALILTRSRGQRKRVLAIVGTVFAVGFFVVVPQINSFTGGAFEERFSDTSSGRTQLASNDLDVFKRNIAFGVGPGMTKYNRLTYEICQLRSDRCAQEGSSHTEFTRMLGEHGIPGLIAIGLLITLMIQALRRAGPSLSITVAFLVWSTAQMFYANFRVIGIAFAFAFAFVRIVDVQAVADSQDEESSLGEGPDLVSLDAPIPHASTPVRSTGVSL